MSNSKTKSLAYFKQIKEQSHVIRINTKFVKMYKEYMKYINRNISEYDPVAIQHVFSKFVVKYIKVLNVGNRRIVYDMLESPDHFILPSKFATDIIKKLLTDKKVREGPVGRPRKWYRGS